MGQAASPLRFQGLDSLEEAERVAHELKPLVVVDGEGRSQLVVAHPDVVREDSPEEVGALVVEAPVDRLRSRIGKINVLICPRESL